MIRGDGEGHQRVQIDFACPVGLEQHWCGVAEPQALLHGALRDPETRRDGGRRAARIGQAAECLDLIGRVHGGADTVLGQRNFFGRHDASDHAAGHGVVLVQRAFGGQRLHHGKPPSAGDHRVAHDTIGAGFHGAGNQVLEQPVGSDRGLELGEGRIIGRRLAHIAGREFELGQRDVADIAFGVVHIGLRDCVNAEPGGDTLFGIRPSPENGRARALDDVIKPDEPGTAGPCRDSRIDHRSYCIEQVASGELGVSSIASAYCRERTLSPKNGDVGETLRQVRWPRKIGQVFKVYSPD